MRYKLLIVAVCLFVGACAPELGDGCSTPTECSATGDRYCDRSQPGGYCTIINCEPKSCGDEGVCVRFKPDQPRLASSWCMKKCGNTGDCDRDDYVCRSAADLNAIRDAGADEGDAGAGEAATAASSRKTGLLRAEVRESNTNAKFCVVRE